MFETYRMLGREREAELQSEAERLRPLAGRPVSRIAVVIVAVVVAALAFGVTMAQADVWARTGAQLTTQPSSPDVIERWVASHEGQVGQARPASSSPTARGFDWHAGLVGASTTAALAVLLAIGIGLVRRTRIRSLAT
jgi:hypothetical protein